MPGFAGLVTLGSTIDVAVLSKSSTNVPTDADALPTYRIYGPSGFMVSGALAYKDTGAITGATNANPTVITSTGHNLTTGTDITISGMVGMTNLNGNVYSITKIDSNTFSVPVDGSAQGTYTSGGTWHATGVYDFNYTPTVGNNFASGVVYSVYCYANYSSTAKVVDSFTFQVT